MPPQNEEQSVMQLMGSNLGPQPGPFTAVLQSGLAPGQNQEKPYKDVGWLGAGGKALFAAQQLLQGFQKGRLMSYIAAEAQKQQQRDAAHKALMFSYMTASDPEDKKQILQISQEYMLKEAQGDQTQGKKKGKKSPDEYPSRGGKLVPQGHASDKGEGAGGVISSLFGAVTGGNLPRSADPNITELQAKLAPFQAKATLSARKNDQVGNVNSGIQGYLAAKPDATEEDIRKNVPAIAKAEQEYARITGDPKAAAEMVAGAFQSFGVPSKMRSYQERTAAATAGMTEIAYDEQKRADEEDKEFSRVADELSGPPQGREEASAAPGSMGFLTKGLQSDTFAPQPATPQTRASDQINPSGTGAMWGKAMPMSNAYRKIHKPTVIYAKKGDQVMTLESPNGRIMLEPGTGRIFNTRKASQEGWQFDITRPVRIPPMPVHKGMQLIKGVFYQTEYDSSSGRWNLSLGGDGKPIAVKTDRGAETDLKNAYNHVEQVVTKRNAALNSLETNHRSALRSIEGNANITDKQKAGLAAEETARYEAQKKNLLDAAQAQLDVTGKIYGVSNIAAMFSQQQPTVEEPESGSIGDIGKEE